MMWCLQKATQFLRLVFFFFMFQTYLSSSSSLTQLCSHDEAFALIQFKSSFSIDKVASLDCEDVGIKSYPKTDSWKEGTDCCSWDGVACDGRKGHVISLDLSCSWLYGTIPFNTSLFHLPHLQKINLAFNNFNVSKISSKIGEFESLVYLNLSNSNFAGHVPSHVSHLSKLVSLDLSWNYQTFDKHTLEGLVHNLTEMRQLFLDGTNMSSTNPNALTNVSSTLMFLSLYDCGLGGKFPESIFRLPNLKLLNLGYNRDLNLNLPVFNWSSHLQVLDVSSTIFPTRGIFESIGNLISLRRLNLARTQISGSIPRALGNLLQLNYLDLSKNNLSGEIPSLLFKNLTQLEILHMRDNQLKGSIPDKVCASPKLISLDLSSNLLQGTLPSWLFTLSSLKFISLGNNQFSGHIEEFQCNSLEVIDLGVNKLQGPFPFSIFQLSNLTSLTLYGNNLSGVVEFGMFSKFQNIEMIGLSCESLSLFFNGSSANYKLPNLQRLDLSSCNISEFPQFLRGSKSLEHLHLSHNRIHGKIPRWMLDVGKDSLTYLNLSHNSLTYIEKLPWKKIQHLDLSSNLIHGHLPVLPLTTYAFFISNNSLTGKISSLICEVSSLGFLDLSHNNLSGIIPQCFGNLSKSVQMLNLQMNNFHGIIPPTFTKGCQLKNLNLNGNNLEGPLTRSIMNCRRLEVLDLGNNKIKDTFPHWLGSLPELQVLVLRSNQLQGSIQDARSTLSFPKIQIFDLSNNYFIGILPVRYIRNFNALINLAYNKSASKYLGVRDHQRGSFYSYSIGISVKGMEMELVKIFTKLTTIDLSCNKFQGAIPVVIGKLSALKGLNLSHNNLSGPIPASIGNLINLEWLDLSSNKLVGIIPRRLTDLTSLSVFNVSKNQFHGQIPQGKQFNTFGNGSYEGNYGLCGFPISKSCSNSEPPPPPNLLEEDGSKLNIAFGWKVVLIGYGCGLAFGLAMGYVFFQTGKPKWFVSLVEDHYHKRQKTSRIGNRSGGGKRT